MIGDEPAGSGPFPFSRLLPLDDGPLAFALTKDASHG